jgi:hypothetical protein
MSAQEKSNFQKFLERAAKGMHKISKARRPGKYGQKPLTEKQKRKIRKRRKIAKTSRKRDRS